MNLIGPLLTTTSHRMAMRTVIWDSHGLPHLQRIWLLVGSSVSFCLNHFDIILVVVVANKLTVNTVDVDLSLNDYEPIYEKVIQ